MTDVERLRSLFEGSEKAYGVFIPGTKVDENGKLEGESFTEKQEVTQELWEDHVAGKRGLGIIPIMQENMCSWGCIDVDVYKPPVQEVLERIRVHNLPLSVCYSKSGGLHIFLFVNKPILASLMQNLIGSLVIKLKVGDLKKDLYPRQSKIPPNGTGNWLNMPYFGNTRRALDYTGSEVCLRDFLDGVVKADVDQLRKALAIKGTSPDPEAPPCLQRILEELVGAGNRNTILLNLAVFLKKRGTDDISTELQLMNAKYCKPPLSHNEVVGIAERVAKTSYSYQCNVSPLSECCDRGECLKRKFGISRGGGIPVAESVTQHEQDDGDVSYVIGFRGEEAALIVDSEEMNSQAKFGRKFYDVYHHRMPELNRRDWGDFLDRMGELTVVLPIIRGLETYDMFKDHLQQFILEHISENRVDVQAGLVWVDGSGLANFRPSYMHQWLVNQRIVLKKSEISKFLRELVKGNPEYTLAVSKGNGFNTTVRVVRVPMNLWESKTPVQRGKGEPM